MISNFFQVFNTSLFNTLDDNDLKVALHYDDHPVAAILDDYITLNVGTVTVVKLSIEEVNKKIFLVPSILKIYANSIM